MKVQHFRALWPVLDHTMTVRELADEALPDLDVIMRRSRVRAVSRPRWCIRPGRDVPGSGGAEQVLVADLAVVEVPRNVDSITGETETTRSDRYSAPVDNSVRSGAQKTEFGGCSADRTTCKASRMDETRPGEAA